jgi:hypothetical protein
MRKLILGTVVALALVTMPGVAGAQTPEEQVAEAAFVAEINALRASKGLPGLEVHPNLVGKARDWAKTMADAGRIWHSRLSDGVTADWQKLGENVGVGPSVKGLHAAFVASPHHYENLVDSAFTHVGIGVVTVNGTIYVSEMFMQLTSRPATKAVTPRPPAPAPSPRPVPAPSKPTLRPTPKPAAPSTPPAAPAQVRTSEPAPPPPPTRPKPSLLLVSVLERLHSFHG